jgi:hypothetical protein
VELSVENLGHLPAFMLAASDSPGMLPVFKENKSLGTLSGKRSRALNWQGFGTFRGLFILGPAQIRCADPLGIFPFTLITKETCKLFVYPAPSYVNIRPPGGIPLGVLISTNPFNEDLTRRRSVREYTAGDELRRINWKSSARMSVDDNIRLMVNEYEASLSYPLIVFLNVDPAEYPPKKREYYFERIIEAAASLCVMASRERQALGFILHSGPGSREEIAPAAFTLIPILERLTVLERRKINEGEERAEGHSSVNALLEIIKTLPFGTRLVYAGPSLGIEETRLINGMKKGHVTLEYLMIDEKALPRADHQYQIKESGYEIL